MKGSIIALHKTIVFLLFALFAAQSVQAAPSWKPAQAEILLRWIERADDEAIELPAGSADALQAAIESGDGDELDALSLTTAREIVKAWRGSCCGERRPGWWHIEGALSDAEIEQGLHGALEADRLEGYFHSIRPSHAHYQALAEALARETDPARHAVLAKNLARWRWMPAELGDRYVLVNIASQQATLWDGGILIGEWRVIIGKPTTRTPVFTTDVTGVILNPWWEIPASIAAEGIGSFVRRNPAAARARGYVYQNGRYRQMPGDNNALGRVKLVMPNPYGVLLHDTSNRELFSEPQRAFSHGCVRIDRALEFAAVLLDDKKWGFDRIEAQIETDATLTVRLSDPVPVYVTYFTAEPARDGSVRFFEDIYNRDGINLTVQHDRLSTDIYGSLVTGQSSTSASPQGASPCQI